jgi:pimeloyl-ACP methyl ester carboxylesterase
MPPALAFFPGASGARAFWEPVADRLPREWDTLLLSWPGVGAQAHDPTIRSYDDLIARAGATIPDGSDVIAQSMGGLIAMGLAITEPNKIRRLVLVATSGGLNVRAYDATDWREEYVEEFPGAAEWVTTQHVDYSDQLHQITAPTCLIWGDADTISPPAVGRALHRALPSSNLHLIPGGTHMLAREHPEQVAALITNHLS